ncbi:competence pheromone ComX [Bacillus kexueae]|uniref:competence pheromone ComX n=1 Tax=Aeribacillus kexueae TaxID=2078952 RepID=UPI001FAE81F9|nr:competence pheromone ComX [Bacillus kexueae]
MRIAQIVHHLHKHPEELVAVLIGRASLLNVSKEELQTIKQVFMIKKEKMMNIGVVTNGKND